MHFDTSFSQKSVFHQDRPDQGDVIFTMAHKQSKNDT